MTLGYGYSVTLLCYFQASGHHTGAPLVMPGLEPLPPSGKHFCLSEEAQKVKVQGSKVVEVEVSHHVIVTTERLMLLLPQRELCKPYRLRDGPCGRVAAQEPLTIERSKKRMAFGTA